MIGGPGSVAQYGGNQKEMNPWKVHYFMDEKSRRESKLGVQLGEGGGRITR